MKASILRAISTWLKPFVLHIITHEPRFWGQKHRAHIHPTAKIVNTLFNTASGDIHIGQHTFFGHDVLLLTGSHSSDVFLAERQIAVPREGNDIHIGQGVWIGSGAIILGPATIGDHAVVASGAVVTPGSAIPAKTVVAGIPAKIIKEIT